MLVYTYQILKPQRNLHRRTIHKMDGVLGAEAQICDWTAFGDSQDALVEAIIRLYWEGVTREVGNAILCMKHLAKLPPMPEEEEVMERLPDTAAAFVPTWGELLLLLLLEFGLMLTGHFSTRSI
jgi:hypothetical protein